MAARAIVLAMAGTRRRRRREAAEEAGYLAERLHYPVGQAAALRRAGTTTPDAEEGAEHAARGARALDGLNRPLDAAACELLIGTVLRDAEPGTAAESLETAAEAFERLGVAHMTERAKTLTAS